MIFKRFFNKLILLDIILKKIIILIIKIYQKTISPDKGIFSFYFKGKICIHYPHCSEFCLEAIKKYNIIKALYYCLNRVFSCHPFGKENSFFYLGKVYDPLMYKVAFFGSAEISNYFLKALLESDRFDIRYIITTPDKPAGRGLKIKESCVKKFVKNLGKNLGKNLENLLNTPSNLNELKLEDIDLIVVVSYGKILPKYILEIPKLGSINVHGSLLPLYRGASPIQSCILNKEEKTGITIMLMNEKLDEGDILDQLEIPIDFKDKSIDIVNKFIEIGPRFLLETLERYVSGDILPRKQIGEVKRSYKIKKEDGLISLDDKLETVWFKYKAFYIWPGIYFIIEGKIFKITYLDVDEKLFYIYKDYKLYDGTLNKAIINIKIRPEGKKDINFNEFINGYIKGKIIDLK